MYVSASIAGPVIGGVFAEHFHWSLIFWINLPLGLGALAMTANALKKLPRHERPHKLDVIGASLMVAASVVLMLALTWGGSRYPWASLPIVALIAASLALWIAFAFRLALAPEPLIPLAVMRDNVVAMASGAAFCAIGTITALTIFLPLYLELVLGIGASGSGLALISFLAGTVAGSLIAGQVFRRFERYKRLPILGLIVAIASLIVFAVAPGGLSLAAVAALLLVGGTGVGVMYPTTTVAIQNAVLPHQFGTATGAMNFFRSLGGALVVAIFGAIVLTGVGAAEHGLTLETLVRGGAQADFAGIFRWVFAAAAAILAVGLVFILLMEERPLRATAIPAPSAKAAE